MYTRIQKWGNSQAVRLPKAALEMAGLKESDDVQIVVKDGIITIVPVRRHISLAERIAEYRGDYQSAEWDTGKPAGSEEL